MSSDTTHDETGAPITAPVADWGSDYDIFDPEYVRDPFPTIDQIRSSECPIAHTERAPLREEGSELRTIEL